MAVQLIGENLPENESEKMTNNLSKAESSQFDNLAFEMYVDTGIAQLLKQLEERKQKAVQGINELLTYFSHHAFFMK